MFQAQLLRQDWNQSLPQYWNDNSPFKTHFLNALSITLPDCEKFFIETIIPYSKELTDPNQLAEVKEFVKQESHHRHAHKKYNDWLAKQGLPVTKLQQDQINMWRIANRFLSRANRLALTICVEHITVVYASVFLEYRAILNDMHPHFRQIWKWHALEEIEHKAVAINVWNELEGNNIRKNLVMLLVLPAYIWYVGKNTIAFLYADKELFKWQTLKDGIYFLFNKQTGLLRKSLIPWFDFMKKNFHPNDQDHVNILQEYTK